MTFPAPNTSPSGEHGCKALGYDAMPVGGTVSIGNLPLLTAQGKFKAETRGV